MANNTSSARLPTTTAGASGRLPSVVSILTPSRWSSSAATLTQAAAFVAVAYEELSPQTPEAIVKASARKVAEAGYTDAELADCLMRLARDSEVAKSIEVRTPNPYWLLPHVERIIRRGRQIRRQLLDGRLDDFQVGRLLADVPELSWGDFQRCGYTADDRPLYRYAPGISVSREGADMQKLWGRV